MKLVLTLLVPAVAVGLAAPAHASYTLYTGAVNGYVSDSATAAYLAAQGSPTELVSFNTLADGTTAPISDPIAGNVFSTGVDFASANGQLVEYSGPSYASEIGPEDSGFYTGTLFITLASPATAVGFGTVSPNVTAKFYDAGGSLVETTTTADEFDFVGVVGDAGSQIKTIDLSYQFFAIQDFQYLSASAAAIPEPTTWACMLAGFAVLGIAMRHRKILAVTAVA